MKNHIEVSDTKYFDPGVKNLETEISRGGSVHRDSQLDKTMFPTKKPAWEYASTDMYRCLLYTSDAADE